MQWRLGFRWKYRLSPQSVLNKKKIGKEKKRGAWGRRRKERQRGILVTIKKKKLSSFLRTERFAVRC